MEVTFHGHAFFEIEATNGTTVLTDPFLRENPLTDADYGDFDPDVVAVTHGDVFDHAGEAHEFDATVLCQSPMVRHLRERGHTDAVDLNLGGRCELQGVTFTMTQAFHSLGTDSDVDVTHFGGVAAGYVIDDGDVSFYHAGDTCLFGDMETVVGEVYDPDVAAVPIGGHHTMEPDHAAVAVDWLDVDTAIPIHYDTFPEVEQDPGEFVAAVDTAEVVPLEPGESVEL